MKNFSLLLLIVICFYSCKVQPVTVTKVESVQVRDKTINNAKVELVIKINNPNWFKIKVKDYNLEALINTKSVGELDIEKKVVIPKKSESTHTITIGADLSKATGVLAGLMISKVGVINVKGNIKVKAFIFRKKIEIDVKEKFSAKDLQF